MAIFLLDRSVRILDENGLLINAGNPFPVTATIVGGSGGVAQADKSSFIEGTTFLTPIGGVFNEALGADPSEDSAVAIRSTAKRALHVNLRTAAGVEIGTASSPIRVDLTGTTTQPVIGTKTNNAAAPGATNIGALVALAHPMAPTLTKGNQTLLSVDLAGSLRSVLSDSNAIVGKVKVTDGDTVATVRELGNNGALNVAVVDSSGNQISDFMRSISTENPLPVIEESDVIIDTGNSTNIPLGVSGVFTGAWIEVLGYAAVSVNVIASASSTTNGVAMQFSSNGIDIDNGETYSTGGNTGRVVFSPVRAKYFRFTYTNGTTAHTYFRVQALLHTRPTFPLTDALIFDTKSTNWHATPVASYGHVFNGTTWDRLRGNLNSQQLYNVTAQTTTPAATDQTNYSSNGVLLTLNVTSAPGAPGTGGLQVTIEGKDTIFTQYFQLNATPAKITTVSKAAYAIYPGAIAPSALSGSQVVQATGIPLPRTWRVRVVHTDGQAYSYTLALQYTA